MDAKGPESRDHIFAMKPEADAAVKRAVFGEGGNIARMRTILAARKSPMAKLCQVKMKR